MDETQKAELERQITDAKFQLTVLQNIMNGLFVTDNAGNRHLRPNVKEKDIEMLSDAILKIKSSYKDIAAEMSLMEGRESLAQTKYSNARNNFISFAKETGIKIPTFFKDYYQIDG